MSKERCHWVNLANPLYIDYHDNEWGKIIKDDCKLFEILILEGAQAGLKWETILNKREGYRQAFSNFNLKKILKFTDEEKLNLYSNPNIIRNKNKINSVFSNAKAFKKIQDNYGSFSKYFWAFSNNTPVHHELGKNERAPSENELSKHIALDLKTKGFNFVGPKIIYSFMQVIGMINDHTYNCFLHNRFTNWSVYIIECAKGQLYTGISNNVKKRFINHQLQKPNSAKYLRGKGPLKIVYINKIGLKSDALKEELRIKKLTRIEKLKMIDKYLQV